MNGSRSWYHSQHIDNFKSRQNANKRSTFPPPFSNPQKENEKEHIGMLGLLYGSTSAPSWFVRGGGGGGEGEYKDLLAKM